MVFGILAGVTITFGCLPYVALASTGKKEDHIIEDFVQKN